MQRSGTTLLGKLLDNHGRLSLLSQPFPLLFVEIKRRFLRHLGAADTPYPLGDLFLEDRYREENLRTFLADLNLSRSDLHQLCDCTGYSGQYTRFSAERLNEALGRVEPGNAALVLAQLYRWLAAQDEADWFGGKETLWEEFLPFLLDNGFAAILVLRDPRDVLASLNHGRGADYAGRVKPTLFNVRNWRKSVAYALHLEQQPRFLWLRYEDLVHRPDECLGRITALPRADRWSSLARSALRSDLYGALASLTSRVVRATPDGGEPVERVTTWEERYAEGLGRARATLAEIGAQESFDLATLSVALRVIRTLATQGG